MNERVKIMKNIIFALFTASMACIFSGCTATKPDSSLAAKAARMSPELLRSQVLRYKALVEEAENSEQRKAMAEIFNTFAPPDEPFSPKSAASISKALAEIPGIHAWSARYQEDLDTYHFFYRKLKEKGGDMTGLELEIESDYEYDYKKYISPPIKEPPAPHSEPQTPEPT
jgi:hypothetical protein